MLQVGHGKSWRMIVKLSKDEEAEHGEFILVDSLNPGSPNYLRGYMIGVRVTTRNYF